MLPWHHGRRFFACRCGARDETTDDTLPGACWSCGHPAPVEWVPPAVQRERDEEAALIQRAA